MTAKKQTEEEWDTIAEARTKIIFDEDGDVWEGFYEGEEGVVDPNTSEVYPYLNFRDEAGDAFQTSASYQLKRAFSNVNPGTYVRIQRLSTTPTAKGKMINFRVQKRN